MKPVRVRFAPSPTGALHIGGVRTALYNYLLARQTGGTMILRIEDTDQTRYVPGAEDYILKSLAWAGINIDEGVGKGGPHAPYRQSERKAVYKQFADQLLASGHAYYAFDTEEELETLRKASPTFLYGSATRQSLKNSLTLSPAEVTAQLEKGQYVIRIKIPEGIDVKLNDLIRGEVIVNSSQLDDKVLMKSDGMPTYHLANVVDDYLMKISHVIRGEEWLPSAPLHVLLYRFLGWEESMPQFAHLPLLLKPDGNGKLSKRDADRMGFPIFPLTWIDPKTQEVAKGFKESGYLPEALINFLAFLGWNPGTEQEIFSMEELIKAFSIERIGKAGTKFDIHKAQWFNQQYLKAKTSEELAQLLLDRLAEEKITCDQLKAVKIATALKERITYPDDLWLNGKFYFEAPTTYDQQVVAKKWNTEATTVLSAYAQALVQNPLNHAEEFKQTLESVTSQLGIGTGKILQALRVAITGQGSGPDLMLSMEIIGRIETANRIQYALHHITSKV